MRVGPFALLGLLAAMLAALIALEIDSSGTVTDDPALPVVIRRAPLAQLRARAASAPVDHTDEWVAAILARPLFSRDRRPAPPAAQAGPSGPAAPDGLPRLTGTMVGPFGRSAIFAGPEGGKPTVVNEGSNVGVYTVSSIGPGQVTIEGPDGTRVLHPIFDPNAPRRDAAPPTLPVFNNLQVQPGLPLPQRRPGDSGLRVPPIPPPNGGQAPEDPNQAPSQ